LPSTSPNLILQYWQLALSGAALVGCQPQYGCYPSQFAIAEGAKLTGTVTDAAVQLQIAGNVVDGSRPFAASLAANRVG
jgi:hypothetical protein